MAFQTYKMHKYGWHKNDRLEEFLEIIKALKISPGAYVVTDIDRQHLYYLRRRTGIIVHTSPRKDGKTEVWLPTNSKGE